MGREQPRRRDVKRRQVLIACAQIDVFSLNIFFWGGGASRYAQGATFVNQYIIIKTLGHGTFGRVKLGLNSRDDCLYALKLVNKRQLRRFKVGVS
jgi:serine/threonine protein kinase